jgi:hypothetical protein
LCQIDHQPLRGFGFLKFVGDEKPRAEKPKREKRVKQKNDPKYVAAARELRDRWLERVNATPLVAEGKYDVTRTSTSSVESQLEPAPSTLKQTPLLNAA